jgi:hypothetical protein
MVDALRDAWRVLRRRGVVIDARPAVEYRPRLAIRQRDGRHVIGDILRERDPGIAGARRAVRETVRDGWFTVVSRTSRRWSSRYSDLEDLRWLGRVNDSWTITPALWKRVRAAWPMRNGPEAIEIGRAYSLTILRKQAR